MDGGKRAEGRELAEFAATYGLWNRPSYLDYVRLWLNLDAARIRRTWEMKEAVELALNKRRAPLSYYLATSPNHATAAHRSYEDAARQREAAAFGA